MSLSFRFFATAALGAACPFALSASLFGCSSDVVNDTSSSDEGALVTANFNFDVDSDKERAGEVEIGNAYWASRLADYGYQFDTADQVQVGLAPLGINIQEVVPFHAGDHLDLSKSKATTGTDGFYLRTDKAGFLVFRGTQENQISDVIVDIRVGLERPGPIVNEAGNGNVHSGFYNGLHAVWDYGLHDELKKQHGDGKLPLYVIGHSLGGALSTVATHHLLFDGCLTSLLRAVDLRSTCTSTFIPVKAVYTFGSPRVGDEKFATTLHDRIAATGTKMFRFVNEDDNISMLPQYSGIMLGIMSSYRHVGVAGAERDRAVFLDYEGAMYPDPDSRCSANSNLVQCDITMEQLAINSHNGKPPWLGEHSRSIYIEKLRALYTGTIPRLAPLREAAVK